MIDLSLFQGDSLPDATWGLCGGHKQNPQESATVVRFVDENGNFAAGGMCQLCWEELRNGTHVACPLHGIRPKGPDGKCNVAGCVGAGFGPTQAEIEREAESLCDIWPGGPLRQQGMVDAPAAQPASGRYREALASLASNTGAVPEHDGRRVDDGREGEHPVLIVVPGQPATPYIVGVDPAVPVEKSGDRAEVVHVWRDPFLDP